MIFFICFFCYTCWGNSQLSVWDHTQDSCIQSRHSSLFSYFCPKVLIVWKCSVNSLFGSDNDKHWLVIRGRQYIQSSFPMSFRSSLNPLIYLNSCGNWHSTSCLQEQFIRMGFKLVFSDTNYFKGIKWLVVRDVKWYPINGILVLLVVFVCFLFFLISLIFLLA